MREWQEYKNFREFWSLVFGFPKHDILLVNSRHGQWLPVAFEGFGAFHYDPRIRPSVWCFRFWFTRIFLTKSVPRNVRSLVAIARTVGASRIVASDAFRDLMDVESSLPETKLFWTQHGLYLDQSGSTLQREDTNGFRDSRIVLFALSEYDQNNYRRWGASKLNTIPVGSLNNGIHEKTRAQVSSICRSDFDICLIEKGLKLNPDSDYGRGFKENWDNFLPIFSEYINSERPRLIVAVSKSSERSAVVRYLYDKLKYDFTITDEDDFSTYRASDLANVTIGIASTVLAESLSRKRKVLSFNCTTYTVWDFPGSNFVRINSEPQLPLELLRTKLNETLALSWEDYAKKASETLQLFAVDGSKTIDRIRHEVTDGLAIQ